ncbi:hypothetical protein C343_03148 [Cryptococcus neoformans C23]|uniref:Cytochrome b561 domain-containing protein n=2 Tax=Cryptococcus neoformans TaxID=5207 RepID=A0A854QDW0_CRYNE|nr:hypothetical protein CNAG_01088 [Cryptococcus neoformans var. grubii H99]AUB24800.1 hypothetical protein CKF44_01088 [Cryptococcus neoformans var. grubii]OWZ32512.1 hypothetical protein C347_03211 [Cryptococcus neoformans var. grubii AD2-60a]OWZ44034.1 hypothetical protein C353_03051 [Cryptococcus neoformans var. grubii AD1-83a]OWZ44359.1 hypothetical protein C343_03148 [Cryptococcus neoformans var. grubii C23]OWZ57624.1 hypothetical protein C368_00790 [Cryptococcus neoformans var. grubii 1|eukprot:XP_012049064.1 hypothetical protein CNAG_01088 [Cryptococcus neoformans var. grubii H99]
MLGAFNFWWMATLTLFAVLKVEATVTGEKWCNSYLCVTGKHDSSQKLDLYTLEPPQEKRIARDDFGWIAIGFGSTMANTPMVITWPNSDGTITLSQREASSNVMPTVVSSPSRKASLKSSLSYSNSSSTSITFTVPSNSFTTNQTSLIWAYSKKNPGNSAVNAMIKQHTASGNTELNLLSTLMNSTNTTVTSGADSESPADSTSRQALIAHVACGAVATMALFPSGILVPRIARGLTGKRWWFPVHGVVNGLLGFGFVVAAFGIAKANFSGGYNSTHRKLGLALFVLCIFQTLLGLFAHFYQRVHRLQTTAGRGPTNFIHMALGLVIIAVGWGTVWKGLDEEWGMYSGTGQPGIGWKAGWGLIVALASIAYLGGLYLLPRQLSFEHQRRLWASSLGHASPSVQKSSSTIRHSTRINGESMSLAYLPNGNGYGDLPNNRLPPPPPPLPPPPPTHLMRLPPPPIPPNRPAVAHY